MPDGYKKFTKTKPLKEAHLKQVKEWWFNRTLEDKNSYSVTIDEIKNNEYNLDFKNPNKLDENHEITIGEILDDLDKKSNNIINLVNKLHELLRGVEE